MADARLIIHHHRDDDQWARRLRRVAGAFPDVVVSIGEAPEPQPDQQPAKHIHICSPAYAATPRVLNAGEHYALIVAGEPGASAFDGAQDEECLPVILSTVHRTEARYDRRIDGASPETIACEAVAVALGVDLADVCKPIKRRRFVRGFYVGLAAVILAALAYGSLEVSDRRELSAEESAAAVAVSAAAAALDAGEDGAAYSALATALGQSGPLSAQGATVLERAVQETRLLADFPAPAEALTGLSFLSDGVIAATSANGGAWLVDPGAGVATQISEPSPGVVARLSPAGDRLWTARPGPPTEDETGTAFAPLTFVDIDLGQAEVVSETVIRAPIGRLSEGAISPDGALFAADLGPGAGAETVIGVFRRGDQALAGALRLPSDQADIRFVGPDWVLAVINPPSSYGDSPGLYLWRVGAAAPIVLRRQGLAPLCATEIGKSEPTAIRQQQAAGDLLKPQILSAPSGREIALLLPRLDRGACLLRWAAPTGAMLPTIEVPGRATGAEVLAEGGPYLIRRKGRAATVLRPGASATTLTPCRTGAVLPLSPAGGRAEAFLCEDGDDGVVASPSGAVWRRSMHEGGVTVAAPGPGGLIATSGRDGRIRLWDGAARVTQAPADLRDALSFHVVPSKTGAPHVAALYSNGLIRVMHADGAATDKVIPTELANAEVRSYAADRVAVLGDLDGAKYWRTVDLEAGQVSDGSPRDPMTRFVARGPVTKSDRWTERIFEADDGSVRTMVHAMDRTRTLLDIDLMAGATAIVEQEGTSKIWVRLAGRGVAKELQFEGRGGAIRLSPTGDVALFRIEAAKAPHDDEFLILDVGSGRRIRIHRAPAVSGWFDFSASGDSFAIRSVDQTATIPIFATGNGRRIGAAPGGRAHPIWAPMGDVMATGGAGEMTVTEVRDGQAQTRCARTKTPSRHLAFTPDGGGIIASARAGGLTVVDAATCAIRHRAPDLRVHAAPFAPTPSSIWVPTEAGASILNLGGTPINAADIIKRRAQALATSR